MQQPPPPINGNVIRPQSVGPTNVNNTQISQNNTLQFQQSIRNAQLGGSNNGQGISMNGNIALEAYSQQQQFANGQNIPNLMPSQFQSGMNFMHSNGYYQGGNFGPMVAQNQGLVYSSQSYLGAPLGAAMSNGPLSQHQQLIRPHSAFSSFQQQDTTNMQTNQAQVQQPIQAGTNDFGVNPHQSVSRRLFPTNQASQVAPPPAQQNPSQVMTSSPQMNNGDSGSKLINGAASQSIPSGETSKNTEATECSIFSHPPSEGFGLENPGSLQAQTQSNQQLLNTQVVLSTSERYSQPAQNISTTQSFQGSTFNSFTPEIQSFSQTFQGAMPQNSRQSSILDQHHHPHAQSQQILMMTGPAGSTDQGLSSYASSSGSQTQRGPNFRKGPRQNSNEVMIHNIDKETITFIAQELHRQDVIEISQLLIHRNILIVRFRTQEGAQWAIRQYNKKTINSRELQVTIAVDTAHLGRRRLAKWESTNLAQITETPDFDEDLEQESSAENINQSQQPNLGSPSQDISGNQGQARSKSLKGQQQYQQIPEINESFMSRQGAQSQLGPSMYHNYSVSYTSGGLNQLNQSSLNQQQYKQMTGHPGHSITPSTGYKRHDQVNMNPQVLQYQQTGAHPSQYAHQQAIMMNGFAPSLDGVHANYLQQTNSQPLYPTQQQQYQKNQQFLQQQLGGQMSARTPGSSQLGFFPSMQDSVQSGHQYRQGGMGNQFQPNHYMTQPLSNSDFLPDNAKSQQQNIESIQDQANFQEMQAKRFGVLSGQENGQRPNQFMEQIQKYNNQDIIPLNDQGFPPHGFGFNHQFQQIHMGADMNPLYISNLPNNFSSSIDNSQQDEENFSQNIVDPHYSGSERESLVQPNQFAMTTRNVLVGSSTRNSDSDNSQKFNKLHFHHTQQFQSPISARKANLIYQESSFEYHKNAASNSGHDTPPPTYMTPGQNKNLNNSFSQMTTGQQHLSQIRSEAQFRQINHNRNLSHNQHLSQMMVGQDLNPYIQNGGQSQFYLSQPMNLPNIMNRQSFMQCASSSSDINDMNSMFPFSGLAAGPSAQPFMPHQTALLTGQEFAQLAPSSSNSSFDIQSQKSKKKGTLGSLQNNNSKSFQSHKSLKYQTYSESSITSDQSQFEFNWDKIKRSEDIRTTVMIRHIPNKYNQKQLLSEINKNHQGKYDFFYLPIDYQNQANVGYAFVNFVNHLFILDFHKEFNQRKWQMFNSKKRCELKYGRIQGLEELKRHFHASSVMNQNDENFRPRIFEHHSRMDWTAELKKIAEKYKIVNLPQMIKTQQPQTGQTTTQSQGSTGAAAGGGATAQHIRQQSYSSNMTVNASQAAISSVQLVEASVEEEDEEKQKEQQPQN